MVIQRFLGTYWNEQMNDVQLPIGMFVCQLAPLLGARAWAPSCGLSTSLVFWFPPSPAVLLSHLQPCAGEFPARQGCSSFISEQSTKELLAECVWSPGV